MTNKMREELSEKISGKSYSEIKSYAESNEGTLLILNWELISRIQESMETAFTSYLDFTDETLTWILSDKEILEMLMTSGGVRNNKYVEALQILSEIVRQDTRAIKTEPMKLRLAVATALTHSMPVLKSDSTGGTIDWMSRYRSYLAWQNTGQLYSCFKEL